MLKIGCARNLHCEDISLLGTEVVVAEKCHEHGNGLLSKRVSLPKREKMDSRLRGNDG